MTDSRIKNDLDNIKKRAWSLKTHFIPPKNIKTKKAKIAYVCFKVDYIRRMGQNYIGRFTGALPEFAGIYAIMQIFGIPTTPAVFGMIMLMWLSSTMSLGYLILHYDLDLIESVIGIERNQFQKELYQSKGKEDEEL